MIENVKVEAFDDEGNSVGVFDSIHQASRKLFIKNRSTIHSYIFGAKNCTFKAKKRGVVSYKNGKVYHFKVVK